MATTVPSDPTSNAGKLTQRGRERAREDEVYHSVIVKRVDTARRHPDDILEHAIEEGVEQLQRPRSSLFLSAIAGGVMVSFSALAVAVMTQATMGMAAPMQRLLQGLVYPLGFIICIMASTELFTEHTATAVYPVLDRRSGLRALVGLWAVVLAGNLLGALGGAGMLTLADGVVGAREGYLQLADHVAHAPTGPMFASSVLAGSLMALGAWLIYATRPGPSQLALVFSVTFLIGVGGLHHSIAGSAELFAGVWLGGGYTPLTVLRAIGIAALGNLVGGSVLVAILNYGHVRESQTLPEA